MSDVILFQALQKNVLGEKMNTLKIEYIKNTIDLKLFID